MLIENLYGTMSYDLDKIEKTYDRIFKLVDSTISNSNIAFSDLEKGIKIETVGKGNHFQVAEVNDHIHDVKAGFYKIDNLNHFIDFVLDFSFERLNEFEKDEDMSLKFFIDHLTDNQKEKWLYELLKNKSK